jgi:hypothetical protein
VLECGVRLVSSKATLVDSFAHSALSVSTTSQGWEPAIQPSGLVTHKPGRLHLHSFFSKAMGQAKSMRVNVHNLSCSGKHRNKERQTSRSETVTVLLTA